MYILAISAFLAITNSNRYARYRRMAEFYEIEIQTTSAALKDEREDELRPRDEHNIQHSSHFDKLQSEGLINAVGQSSNTSNSILLALEFNVMVVKPCLY
jgi:hypothetical protein